MSSSAVEPSAPIPLHLPAILQNPGNHALRQVEAYNTQQRDKLCAKRVARAAPTATGGNSRGKRVVRRRDNAAFTSNPHITPPSRGDYYPPVPLHPHPARQSFPASTIPRSASIPPVTLPERDPFAPSSLNGAFSTSLKGTRAMLRKRGRRVESLVGIVEEAIRGWLSGPSWTSDDDEVHGCWRVIDKTLVDVEANEAGSSTSPSSPVDRRLPSQHQIKTTIPPLPQSSTNKRCPAILELSRSPAHLSWAVADPFERLVVHLLVRYYELISWSEDHRTESGGVVRLTHIIVPSLVRPKPPPTTNALLTPETSDLSAPSSSDRETTRSESGNETESGAGTEMGEEIGYSLEPERPPSAAPTPSFEDAMAELDLRSRTEPLSRAISASSSMYASSEGESDGSGMIDSLTLPLPPSGNGGWTAVSDTGSEAGEEVPAKASDRIPVGTVRRMGWEGRPTFFEYLYGA